MATRIVIECTADITRFGLNLFGPDYFGNYYPLTDYSLSKKEWIGWQFASLDGGRGFVQAFRREHCVYTAAEFKLRGLDPSAIYVLHSYDTDGEKRVSGKHLMEVGIPVEIPKRPGAATIRYVRAD